MKSFSIILLVCIAIFQECVAPPAKIKEKKPEEEEKPQDSKEKTPEDLNLDFEYKRYLQEVVEALESDPDFRKKLEKADQADFYNGKIASELEFVNHNVRTKLDELKRTELHRLNDLIKRAHEAENEVDPSVFHPPQHVDHTNPLSFEVADLHKLITKVTQDLSEADQQRREEFKQYEMEKEFEKEQKLKSMDEKHKEEYLHKMDEQKKRHSNHPHVHHPGSKAQLEEVWQKQDQMDQQEFNPKTFFYLHDLDGNGYWDETEVKALFKKELDKLFQSGQMDSVDMRERYEEMERMREEFFKDVDTNRDHLISLEELLSYTKKKEFQQDEGWQSLDQQQMYTQKEYEEFEARRLKEIQKLIDQGVIAPHPYGAPIQPQYQQYPPHYPHQQPHQGHQPGYQPHPQGYQAQHVQGGYPQPPHGQPHHPQGHHQPMEYHQQGYPPSVEHHQQRYPPSVEHHQQGHPQAMGHHQQQGQHDPPQHHQPLHQPQAHHQEHNVNQQDSQKQQQQYANQYAHAPPQQYQQQQGYQHPPPHSKYPQPPPGAYQQPPQYQQQGFGNDDHYQQPQYQPQGGQQPPPVNTNHQPAPVKVNQPPPAPAQLNQLPSSSSVPQPNQPRIESSQQNPPQPARVEVKAP